MVKKKYKVLVLDMQPIDPPVGGGRLRLLGLYHNLGDNFITQYIGTYDWPGEKFRDHLLSDSLREVDIPLSDEHFTECRKWQERVGGKTIIDSTFPILAHLSKQYVDYTRSEVLKADVVIFSHPWVYPLVKDLLNKAMQIIIYDSHNVEGYLRHTLLDDKGLGTEIVKEVVKTEFELCHIADVIFTCSLEDCELFNKLYSVPFIKMRIVPNGVFTEKIRPIPRDEKVSIKRQLELSEQKTAIFIGSNYPPNLEACNFIIKDLAPLLPEVTFVIAGGVGEGIDKKSIHGIRNVKITGSLTENQKVLYLGASDLAINPMFSGSGTNIKMFDFMAAGLPIVSTKIGARGISETDYAGIVISDILDFKSSIQIIINDDKKSKYLGNANRKLTEKNFSWGKISPQIGVLLINKLSYLNDVENSSANRKGEIKKFALMSSWNLRCGIAEHSRHLVDEFEAKNIDVRIITNSNGDLTNSNFIDDLPRYIYPLWKYDNLKWKDTRIDFTGIIKIMQKENIFKLNIQYHTGFFNPQILLELVRTCYKENIEVFITLHNSKEVDLETLVEINQMSKKLVVHSLEDKLNLIKQGINRVYHIPIGVLDFPDEDKNECRSQLGITGDPIIGSFGFIRPHKGLLEAIEAINILKEKYPDVKLLCINALYPSQDSQIYYKTCIDRINELNLHNHIILKTSFIEMDEIIHYLHTCDVIVLPYHDSKEGSSAAGNTVISAKRPLIISPSGIFSSIRDVSYQIENINPSIIALGIQNILQSPKILIELKNKVDNYINENSYSKIADKYVDLIFRDELDYEIMVQKVYESILEDGDNVIDVGAHIGRHTIPIAKKIAPNGKVFAIEPLPMCQDSLHDTINLNFRDLESLIVVYPYALGDFDGESDFTIVLDDLGYSGLKERNHAVISRLKHIKVPVRKIDNLFSDLTDLKYVKIDAEGGEYNILKGGINTIKKFRPVITFEFGENSYAAYSVIPEQVFGFWQEINYKIYDILGNLLDDETAFSQSSITQQVWDYIAIPAENRVAIEKILSAIREVIIYY